MPASQPQCSPWPWLSKRPRPEPVWGRNRVLRRSILIRPICDELLELISYLGVLSFGWAELGWHAADGSRASWQRRHAGTSHPTSGHAYFRQ